MRGTLGFLALTSLLSIPLLSPQASHSQTLVWSRSYQGYQGRAGGRSSGNGVAVGGDGSVYVVGDTLREDGRQVFLLQKYSPAGALLWTWTYNDSLGRDAYGAGVAVGPDGGVYAVGTRWLDTLGDHEGFCGVLFKFTPEGTMLWRRFYSGRPYRENGSGEAVAVDGSGNIYVTGATRVPDRYYDLYVRKYDAEGNVLWTRRYDNPAHDRGDFGSAVHAARDGSVYATGYTFFGALTSELVFEKRSTGGSLAWRITLPGHDSSRMEFGTEIASGPDGNVYLAASGERHSHLQQYTADGTLVWSRTFENMSCGQIVYRAGSGLLCAGARSTPGGDVLMVLRQYSPKGKLLWERNFKGRFAHTAAGDIALGPDGSFVVTGWASPFTEGVNLLVQKYR